MPSNVIELVVKTLDEATPGLKGIDAALESLKTTAAAFATVEVFKKFIENTAAAETAQVRLQHAFEHSVESLYTNEAALARFADETGKTSVFSVVAIENMQTALLRFDRVTGPVFEQARTAALNLASALGRDLADTAFQVGRALENPAQGLRLLAAAGVVFSPAQRALITDLVKTGEAAKAQQIILQAIDATYRDSADIATKTLGGSLKRLQNSFEELFKVGKDGSSVFAQFFNAIADGANKAQPVVSKIENSIARIATTAVKAGFSATAGAFNFAKEFVFGPPAPATAAPGVPTDAGRATPAADALARERAIQAADRRAALLASLEEFKPGSRAAGATVGLTVDELNAQVAAADAAMKKFEGAIDAQHTSVGKVKDAMKDLYESWDKETQTAAEKTSAVFHDAEIKAGELLKHGDINQAEYNKRISEATDTALEFTSALDKDGKQIGFVFDTAAIGLRKMQVPLTELQISVHNFVSDFTTALGNLATRGGLSMRNLIADFVRMLADRAIFRAIEAIGTALEKALTPKPGTAAGGSGGSGWIGTVVSVIGALYGRAGGGGFSGLTVVGEEGPELVAGHGTVMNKRQLQFAMGNAASTSQAIHYAPQTNITVQGNADEKTLKYLELRLAQGQKDQRNWLSDTLHRNGYLRLR